ncbi:MAG: arginine--tRNA ligase [Candidatus Micrarchaeota archaeon]|nr:arginine--tRNA ligase [Candidatus Micrarchaeota archaeon]
MMLEIKKEIAESIANALAKEYGISAGADEILNLVQEGGVEGVDIECRAAFRFAKDAKAKPGEVADRVIPHLKSSLYTAKNVNGYINFVLTGEFYKKFVAGHTVEFPKNNIKAIVEYPSINPNKPLHIGHLRNAIIGDCIANLLECCGYDVVRMDYIDDLGLQVAQSLWMCMHGAVPDEGKKYDHWLGEMYVEAAKKYEESSTAKAEVEEIMKKLEEGDPTVSHLGREMALQCVEAQKATLQRLNIFQDVLVWESDIVHAKIMKMGLEILERKGVLKLAGKDSKYAGCKIIELSSHPKFKHLTDADKVIVRANGVATYTAKDIAFQMWKFGIVRDSLLFDKLMMQGNGKLLFTSCKNGQPANFSNAKRIINIIGVEQEYPQSVIKAALEMAGFADEAQGYKHIAYGHARLKEGRFSGRKGTWIGFSADELVDESIARARELINDKFREYGEDEKGRISAAVGIAAIRFSFIRIGPQKELVFDWDKALCFEGDSGPYLQYSYARAVHILEKEKIDDYWDGELVFSEKSELQLIREMAKLEEVCKKAAEAYAPESIADYALRLCSQFNSFYAACRVICGQKGISESRKRLVKKYAEILEVCLRILGIPIIRNM